MPKFPFYQQLDSMDCGISCLRMIAKYYGKHYSLQFLRQQSYIDREGASLLGISDAANSIGLQTMGVQLSFEQLSEDVPLPCIVHWQQRHFVVVYKITGSKVYVADPAFGRTVYKWQDFMNGWIGQQPDPQQQGVALLLEPLPEFYEHPDEPENGSGLRFLTPYMAKHKRQIALLLLAILAGGAIQFAFPFLTQQLIDRGVGKPDLRFIYLILLAQVMLFVGKTAMDFLRSRIILHVGSRVNIAILSDFLSKLMRLPIGFFDTKLTGDLLQRIGDHQRIENFLTNTSLNVLFSLLNLLVFGVVLFLYSLPVFAVFMVGSLLYIGWVSLFLDRRRQLDYKRFDKLTDQHNSLLQLIYGMQEIKLNNFEQQSRRQWENIQTDLFKLSVKSLSLEQYQQLGALFFNEFKNIVIVFLAAQEVVNGSMTLGMMLAVSYIAGQLNGPVAELARFLQAAQDAGISIERLNEIHRKTDEETPQMHHAATLPDDKTLHLQNISFRYGGPRSDNALDNITLSIPQGKLTAIVGTSGSGKTTLVKLLLQFYQPQEGNITLGNLPLSDINHQTWRQHCGVVMQDGYIFSDTIARNIAMSDTNIDQAKIWQALQTANLHEFAESLPLGINTKIGQEGIGLSGGQKQRILIARAVYKNPDFLFFDEATNALDAENERIIMNNLQTVFEGKTVVVVAHRLSTVQNAHQIVVLQKGNLIECGNHRQLTDLKGTYYHLVRNQLEMGT
ncbi:peptidase domain-containing ABC transporter [Sphingobacteriales bacterium UPWRP_1]|nr:ABC transporter ATP-binding protein [Sphingobacteriales bacterium TSM_CSS]PSJ75653.1 peptidase domain-containing ABC transporter [Sphingobacteriales bacterium UPWRP_1]